MQVIEYTPEYRELVACCLEDWSPEVKEAGPARACWIDRFLTRGLRIHLALDDAGQVGGMIQALPIEASTVDGVGLYFIPCIWVHGHKEGRGDFQGHGMGAALLAAAEADAKRRGAHGMAAWGLWLPVWMKASWFRKHGYRRAERRGLAMLVWKPFDDEARPPRWFPAALPVPEGVPGKVTVTSFVNGWCMACNLAHARARRVAAAFGDRVVVREIDLSEHTEQARWGRSDELYIDGVAVNTGPPPTEARLQTLIGKRVARL